MSTNDTFHTCINDRTAPCKACDDHLEATLKALNIIQEPAATPEDAAHPSTSILTEAAHIINGPRRDAYGPVTESFTNIAAVWSAILRTTVTPPQVALCMIALKLLREAHSAARDNRVDICGYAALLDGLHTADAAAMPPATP